MADMLVFLLNGLVALAVLLTLVGAVVHKIRARTDRASKVDRAAYILMRTSPYGVVLGVLWFVVGPVFT